MPAIDIRETGLNSTDPTLVNQNYQLYSSYNDDAAKYRYPLPEGGARPEGVHDAAYYFDQLIRHLNDATARAKEMDDEKIGVTFNHVHNFNLANEFVLRDIDRVLSLETAPDAPENKERMEFVRKLREPVALNMDASVKLKRKLEADLEQELFGESMKVFNETNPFDRDNFNLFIGEKYLDPSVRIRKAHDMPFSVDRSAVLSISVLALINEGMDFETVSDPKKGIERKQAMFDKYSQLIAKGGEDAQNQIAQTLYTGYKNLTKMINDAAVTIDFSQPDLLQNKRYCQLLHLHAVQHDAWQELKHVQNKVVDLAKADDPQIDTYHKLTDHFKDMQSPLLGVRSELMNYREGCKFLACNRELGSAVGQISKSISDYIYSKKTEEMIAQAQARNANTDKPFLQWFTDEEMMFDAFKGPIDPPLAEKLDKYKIVKSAELAHPLAKLISSGEFTKNIRIEGDVSANPQVTGLPSANDIQTMLLNNAKGDEFDNILAGIHIAETRFEPRTQMEKNAVKYMNESENKFEGLVKACADADAAVPAAMDMVNFYYHNSGEGWYKDEEGRDILQAEVTYSPLTAKVINEDGEELASVVARKLDRRSRVSSEAGFDIFANGEQFGEMYPFKSRACSGFKVKTEDGDFVLSLFPSCTRANISCNYRVEKDGELKAVIGGSPRLLFNENEQRQNDLVLSYDDDYLVLYAVLELFVMTLNSSFLK